MLRIINHLRPFFEDCYRRINVREYAKLMHISPPTASKILHCYYDENILSKEAFRKYILFYASKENKIFIELSRVYWGWKLRSLMNLIEKKLTNPAIILFGSLSKAEAKIDSDVDLAVFAGKKDLDIGAFEKILKRKIQIYFFSSIKEIKNKELANNILNGYALSGRLRL